MSTIAERVAAGVAWLDHVLPDWWETGEIDLDDFKMSDGCRCVIGQLYPDGQYADAIDGGWLDLDDRTAIAYGLYHQGSILVPEDHGDIREEYDALQAEWTRVITERRAAA